MSKIAYICLLGLAFSNIAFADSDDDYCGLLYLQISNFSKDSCFLKVPNVIHGNLISSPPAVIMSRESKKFDMKQTVYGPEITLTYQCGQDTITFNSQQNYCFMDAGDIVGEQQFSGDIKVSSAPVTGSWYYHKPGYIYWTIENR